MPINFDDVIQACNVVAQQEEINVCFTESLKGASLAGVGAFTLGVIFGPVGIAVGGAVGGLAGSKMCKSYVPFWKILADMKREDKAKLVEHMMKIIQGLDARDGVALLALVSSQGTARKLFVEGLMSFASQMST